MLMACRFVFLMELRLLWRCAHGWLYPAVFFVIVMCLFPLALSPDPAFLKTWAPGGLWIAALLASLLSMETIFVADIEDGHLDQTVIAALPLPLILLARFLAQWLAMSLPLVLLTPLFGLIFQLNNNVIVALMLSLLAGTPILILLGSLGVTFTLGLRQQGVLLSLLVLPLTLPVLIFGVSIAQQAQAGLSYSAALTFLSGLSVLSMTLLPPVTAATLRITLDD